MSESQKIGAAQLRAAIAAFRDLLNSHRDELNALNVYPVPDGDTGTNMSLTLDSVVSEVEDTETIDEVCAAISHGSLMGARGNSGVIMSQILRGLSDTVATAWRGRSEQEAEANESNTVAGEANEGEAHEDDSAESSEAASNETETGEQTALEAPEQTSNADEAASGTDADQADTSKADGETDTAKQTSDADEAASSTDADEDTNSDDAEADASQKSPTGVEKFEPLVWANAFKTAATAAYGAVQRPVEGTILTVAREIGEEAESAAAAGHDLIDTLERALKRGKDALARTPEMLPVLKDAGVVDACGRGLLLLLDAMLHVADGRPLPKPSMQLTKANAVQAPTSGHDEEKSIADLHYEVMFLLEADDEKIPAFRERWAEIGDSIVVVGGDGLYNCHIHSDEIGPCIEAGIEAGRPFEIRVTDLLEELEHKESWEDNSDSKKAAEDGVARVLVTKSEPVACGVVSVAVGEGVTEIFKSLGVNAVVVGGQTMNPSTELLLEATEAIDSDQVLILPNNKNIIPVAKQLDALSEKTVMVVPTRSVTEGFSALVGYDPEADAQENLDSMVESSSHVKAGEITVAVRDAKSDVGEVKTGDYIGIGRDGILAVETNEKDAVIALLKHLIGEDDELVTLLTGSDAKDETTEAIVDAIEELWPDVEVEVAYGGQPLYPYLLGIE